ncbi:MAG: Hsp20/alpha crystallin family protein [Lachnospiraceae bacterium]|nr:Hsp20/alpha crystallin family protein [Lachnospiraceae bacterium]
MLLPSLFGNDFFDDFERSFPLRTSFGRDDGNLGGLMRADVKENDDGYEVHLDLPGFKKEDVKAQLKEGYLTVTATRQSSVDDSKNEKYIRRERYMGSVSRSFYVGENLTEEDIKAKFDNGTLILSLPKVPQKKVEEDRYITIEG